jgi:hypothetical protein
MYTLSLQTCSFAMASMSAIVADIDWVGLMVYKVHQPTGGALTVLGRHTTAEFLASEPSMDVVNRGINATIMSKQVRGFG